MLNGSNWWSDPRFAGERTALRATLIAAVLLAIFVPLGLFFLKPGAADNAAPPPASPLPSPTPELPQNLPQNLIEMARAHVLENKLPEAVSVLAAAEIEILRLNAIIAWKQNHLDEAGTLFATIVQLSPGAANDLSNLAGVRMQQGRVLEAIASLRLARDAAPGDAYISNRYLLARIEAGEGEAVANEVRQLMNASPEISLPLVAAAAAAIELDRRDIPRATDFLRAARSSLPPGVFQSLLSERPLARHAAEEAMAPFFLGQNKKN